MAEFPLRHRQAWSWWLFVITGAIGFGSFLAYLGYGYLDTWHGVATLLIAHDRAGFGGEIATCGIGVLFCVWCGTPSRSLWQVLCLSGMVGFSTAIGVHPVVGYTDFLHLAPAVLGASIFILGLGLCVKPMYLDVHEAAPIAVES